MNVLGIFAALCVSDLEASSAWYAKVLGRAPDHRPIDTMVQWIGSSGGVQLFLEPDKAGSSRLTIVVPDLAAALAALQASGLAVGPQSHGEFGAVAQIVDPDGNRLTLAQPPSDA